MGADWRDMAQAAPRATAAPDYMMHVGNRLAASLIRRGCSDQVDHGVLAWLAPVIASQVSRTGVVVTGGMIVLGRA